MTKKKTEKKKNPEEVTSEVELGEVLSSIVNGYNADGSEEDKNIAKGKIRTYLKQVVNKSDLAKQFNIVVLYDSSTMVKSDADSIYNAVTSFSDDRPILLVLYSLGGIIGSAYLIGQLCREHTHKKFVITVPRQAKSAATLLCCAGDEIHMGSLSELGPIDPQINGLPALGLKNSIQHIANLVKETPESAEMFARYLNYSVKPIDLGYYERVAESAMQYAEKLLDSNSDKLPKQASAIAHDLVYAYKDHGFVLDKNESLKIFGNDLVKINTDEYDLGNTIYSELSMLEKFFSYFDYNFYLIGCIDGEPNIAKKRKS